MAQKIRRAPSMSPEQRAARRVRALRRFKAVVRLVMANIYWMGDVEEMKISDNVIKNIQLLTRKKVKKSSLTLLEKSILCKPKEERTEEEKVLLNKVIGGMKCFRRYPPNVKSQLAAVTYFTYIGPGRAIVKQDHLPSAMYFMLSGEASVTVKHFDKLLNEWVEVDSGTVGPGTMFGEVALIHGIVRLATITTITPCELLMIKKEDFDLVLKDTVLKAWEEIQGIMKSFSYFKNWDAVTKRECSIMSRTKTFSRDETVLGDEFGLPNYVYFITKGSCCIIEHLVMKVFKVDGIEKYEIFESDYTKDIVGNDDNDGTVSYIINKYLGRRESTKKDVEGNVFSGTTNFVELSQQVPKQKYEWQAPNKTYSLETHFIKVCDLSEGACFNIGENFKRRRVVANSPTNCLLVPRYWILKNNKDNIWNRVQQFLNKHIPTSEQIFKNFLQEKKFTKYRRSLIKELLEQKKVANNNSLHNVPYSIRLKEGIDVDYS